MDSYDILVIILSVMLAIFLLTGIIAGIYVAKFAKNIKEISDKAKDLVDNASSAAAMMRKTAAPAAVAKFVAEQVGEAIKKHNKKAKEE